jgi:hypothetical protein
MAVAVGATQLAMLLDGIDVGRVAARALDAALPSGLWCRPPHGQTGPNMI